jgi:5'-AMP-activated protein kinase catalytic alpha subunit
LKPENILLDKDNNVKIADFGLSNIMKDGMFLYSSCGSPNYAAPELINGKYYNGSSIDIWSCGVILYTLLTGTLPFNEKQTAKLYHKIRECKYNMPPHLKSGAKDLINRMLQQDPLNRITIPEIKQHEWFRQHLNNFQIIDNHRYIYGSRNQIDYNIIHKMLSYEAISKENLTEEELAKKILSKEKKDLLTIYEFLENLETEEKFKQKKSTLKSMIYFFYYNFYYYR